MSDASPRCLSPKVSVSWTWYQMVQKHIICHKLSQYSQHSYTGPSKNRMESKPPSAVYHLYSMYWRNSSDKPSKVWNNESDSQKRHKSATTEVTPENFKHRKEDSDTLDSSSSSSDNEGASTRKRKKDKKSSRSCSKESKWCTLVKHWDKDCILRRTFSAVDASTSSSPQAIYTPTTFKIFPSRNTSHFRPPCHN